MTPFFSVENQPHTDGPLFHPVITTISLGSQTVLHFHKEHEVENIEEETCLNPIKQRKKIMSVLLEPRSLLVVKDDLYHNHLHSIEEVKSDEISESIINPGLHHLGEVLERNTRISLTIRHVPKTSKAKLFLSRKF